MAAEKATFVQLYDGLVGSGLLARLSGSAVKVLVTLGLASTPLGSGTSASRAFARDLVARGVTTPADGGRLFCHLPHHELARRAGLSKNTVSRATAELHDLGLVEKRPVPNPDGTHYNVFFLLPASQIDKFNTHRAHLSQRHVPPRRAESRSGQSRPPGFKNSDTPATLPEKGTVPKMGTVPSSGTKYIQKNTTTPPSACRARVDNNFNPLALLAHFAERQGVARYRPTAHDRRKLDRLRDEGYSQAQVLAAIDRAFDRRPADAPPIRMFSFCATIALAGPAQAPSALPPVTTTGTQPAAAAGSRVPEPVLAGEPALPVSKAAQSPARIQPEITPLRSKPESGAPRYDPDLESPTTAAPPISNIQSPIPDPILTTYTAEIGPLSPLIHRELERLVARYPQAAAWDYAFAEAVRANVRRLSYVEKVLEGQAQRLANPSQGEKNGQNQPYRGQSSGRSPADKRSDSGPGPRRERGGYKRSGGRPRTVTSGPEREFDPVAVIEGRQPFNWHTATEEQMRAVQRAAAAVEPLDYREVLGLSSKPGVEHT